MSKELTPVNAWRTTVTSPASGDKRTALSVEVGLQDCSDREEFIHKRARVFEAALVDTSATTPGTMSTVDDAWQDDGVHRLSFDLAAGQVVHVRISGSYLVNLLGEGASAYLRLSATKAGGSAVEISGSMLAAGGITIFDGSNPTAILAELVHRFELLGYYVIPSSGAYDFDLQTMTEDATGADVDTYGCTMIATVYTGVAT